MTQRKRWLKTREFEKGECVAVRRPGKAGTDRNAKRPPFVCVLVWVYFVHERFESGFRDLTLCVKVLRHVLTLTLMLAKHLRAAAKISDGWPHFWVQIWTPKRGPSKDLKEGMKM